MIDESGLIREFLILIQAISLATLGIRPVRFLLNFVLAFYPSCIHIAHGYSRGSLTIKHFAVHHLASMVHDFASLEYYIFVVQVDLIDLNLGSVVVEIVVFHRLILLFIRRYLGLFIFPVSIEASFSEQTWIIREQILSISEGVLFTSDATGELVR